jgi:hypothetical protein
LAAVPTLGVSRTGIANPEGNTRCKLPINCPTPPRLKQRNAMHPSSSQEDEDIAAAGLAAIEAPRTERYFPVSSLDKAFSEGEPILETSA